MIKQTSQLILLIFVISCGAERPKKIATSQSASPLENFTKVETCNPLLEWNGVNLPNSPLVTYDVAIYKAKKIKKWFERDQRVFYKENYPITQIGVVSPLEPQTAYLWSVRVRDLEDKVSQWSTNSKSIKHPPPVAKYKGQWHAFMTPDHCE